MHQFFMYLDFVPVMEARRQKYFIEAMSYPYMKKHDQQETMRRYDLIDRKPQQIITSQKDVDDSWNFLRNRKT